MVGAEIKLVGSSEWVKLSDMAGHATAERVAGALVRYPTGDAYLVCEVKGVTEPDANGVRHLKMEVFGG